MNTNNRLRVEAALDLLAEGLRNPVDKAMVERFGVDDWNIAWFNEEVKKDTSGKKKTYSPYKKDDPLILLRAIAQKNFDPKTKKSFFSQSSAAYAKELIPVRHRSAHRDEAFSDKEVQRVLETCELLLREVGATDQADAFDRLGKDSKQVVVGALGNVGFSYQPRKSDETIHSFWSDGGDRRLWLRGGPGFGKSYAAKKITEDAILNHGDDRVDLVVWVDSAKPESVISALSTAVDRFPKLEIGVSPNEPNREEKQARALLEVLASSNWGWLVVFDDADTTALIESKLIPVGTNPHGRVLITTLREDHRIPTHGRIVNFEVFTPQEADDYITSRPNLSTGEASLLAASDPDQRTKLARQLGYHPLALSIATSTIITNGLSIPQWLQELDANRLDEAADSEDVGGYPHLISETWRVAIKRASSQVPAEILDRALAVIAFFGSDGIPTWMLDLPSFRTWIAGDATLKEHHGKPVVFQTLLNHSLISQIGEIWSTGLLTMHQLAARSVLEDFTTADFLLLVEDLVEFRLDSVELHLAERCLTTLEAAARVMADLSSNSEIASLPRSKWKLSDNNSELFSGSLQGFVTRAPYPLIPADAEVPQEEWVGDALFAQGEQQRRFGQRDESEASWERALTVFQSLDQDDLENLVGRYEKMGEIELKLGYSEEARSHFERALEIIETLPVKTSFLAAAKQACDKGLLLLKLDQYETSWALVHNALNVALALPNDVYPLARAEATRILIGVFSKNPQLKVDYESSMSLMRQAIEESISSWRAVYLNEIVSEQPSFSDMNFFTMHLNATDLSELDSIKQEEILNEFKMFLDLWEEKRSTDPTDIALIEQHALLLKEYGFFLRSVNQETESASAMEKAAQLYKTLIDLTPDGFETQITFWDQYVETSTPGISDFILTDTPVPDDVIQVLHSLVEEIERFVSADPSDPRRSLMLLKPLGELLFATSYGDSELHPDALALAKRAVALVRSLVVFQPRGLWMNLDLLYLLPATAAHVFAKHERVDELSGLSAEFETFIMEPSANNLQEKLRAKLALMLGRYLLDHEINLNEAIQYLKLALQLAASPETFDDDLAWEALLALGTFFVETEQFEDYENLAREYPQFLASNEDSASDEE